MFGIAGGDLGKSPPDFRMGDAAEILECSWPGYVGSGGWVFVRMEQKSRLSCDWEPEDGVNEVLFNIEMLQPDLFGLKV